MASIHNLTFSWRVRSVFLVNMGLGWSVTEAMEQAMKDVGWSNEEIEINRKLLTACGEPNRTTLFALP